MKNKCDIDNLTDSEAESVLKTIYNKKKLSKPVKIWPVWVIVAIPIMHNVILQGDLQIIINWLGVGLAASLIINSINTKSFGKGYWKKKEY